MSAQPQRIRLFIKPGCGWCRKAINWLDDHDIEHETLDVLADDNAYDEMVKLSGQTLAPVIEVDGKVLADFGPEQLAVFMKQSQSVPGELSNE
jgi:glutaredoxin